MTLTTTRRSLLGSLLATGAVVALPRAGSHAAPAEVDLMALAGSDSASTLSSPAQVGLVYQRFSAISFIPARTVTYTSVPGGIQHSGATSEVFICPIAPAHLSTLKEVEVYISTGPTAGASILLVRFGSDGAVGIVKSSAVAIAAPVQTVTLAVDEMVDIVNFDYELWVSFHNAGTLRGARVGSLPPPGDHFTPIAPSRVYDSRAPQPYFGPLATGQSRIISVADGRSLVDGSVDVADVVPVGAKAISCNVGIVDTQNSGFVTINSGGDTTVRSASINWFGSGQILNNGIIVSIDASRQITAIAGGGGSTNLVIDVTGYFV